MGSPEKSVQRAAAAILAIRPHLPFVDVASPPTMESPARSAAGIAPPLHWRRLLRGQRPFVVVANPHGMDNLARSAAGVAQLHQWRLLRLQGLSVVVASLRGMDRLERDAPGVAQQVLLQLELRQKVLPVLPRLLHSADAASRRGTINQAKDVANNVDIKLQALRRAISSSVTNYLLVIQSLMI